MEGEGRSQSELWDSLYSSNPRAWKGNSRIPVPCGGKALDLGCGNGKTVSSLLDEGFEVIGADFSEEAVKSCIARFGDSAIFVRADCTSLPFPDGTFDYVTAVHVIEHLSDAEMVSFASEVQRVLRIGGFLFVRTFDPDDLRSEKRGSSEIRYICRTTADVEPFFGGFETVSSERVVTPTRFGGDRSRTECLFRRVRGLSNYYKGKTIHGA